MSAQSQVSLQYCKPIPFDFHIENRKLRDMNITLELEVNNGFELPIAQKQILVKSWSEKIVLSRVHLIDREIAREVSIGRLICHSDLGDRVECDLHRVNAPDETSLVPTSSAAIRVIIKPGSHDVEFYAWSKGE